MNAAPSVSTLRVAIIDDEPLARDCMRIALQTDPDVNIVAECGDGSSAVAAIREHGPDVVFLDVQMPGLDGFTMLQQLDAAAMPVVVFVTAYDAHAIRAFEVNALDYVLKPFSDERLLAAVDRARATLSERRHGELGRRLAAFVRDWQGDAANAPPHTVPLSGAGGDPAGQAAAAEATTSGVAGRTGVSSYIARFAVRSNGRVRFVQAVDVDWIEADGNYMVLHVGETTHRVRAAITALAEGLDPKRFVRIHRSVIVNVERIREVQPWFGGDYIAILHSGAKLKVSRLRASALLRPTA
ncbi:MAG TPA: LytTR family DNA-binding domain-containing protein [Gemmatimonadaceae bacterium]|jgi:two-component system LytT family response regulator|nr:LytTR family DNA-binding domain-containing protein [Gemmatimonadaceae bacterium]